MQSVILEEFNNHIKTTKKSMETLSKDIEYATEICIATLKLKGKIILFGNGGSASDSQHIAAELVGRYKTDRAGIPAIALTTDTSVLTSLSNDFGYEYVFERQIQALANKNDVIIGISTSGTSKNVIKALSSAKNLGCKIVGLSGNNGGEMNNICDINIVIPSDDTARVQEMHILIGHTLCHLIEQEFKC